jgi:hypothetical protein
LTSDGGHFFRQASIEEKGTDVVRGLLKIDVVRAEIMAG